MDLKDAIRKISGNGSPFDNGVLAKVLSVDKANRTCDVSPLDESSDILDVKLSPSIKSSKGVLFVPAKGSIVFVVLENQDTAIVAMVSEIDEVMMQCGDESLGGIPVHSEYIKALKMLTARVDAIANALTGFTPVSGDGGAALKLMANSLLASALPPNWDDPKLEDKKFTH